MTSPPPPRVPHPPPPRPGSSVPPPPRVPAQPGMTPTPTRIPVPPGRTAPSPRVPAPQGWVAPPPAAMAPPVVGSNPAHPIPEGSKSYLVTLLLAYLFGMFGADRFYLGKTKTALVKLFTFGGFGYWWLIDLLLTLFGAQRDAWGLRLEGYDRHKKTVWKVIGAVFGASFALGMVALTIVAAFDSAGLTVFGWVLIAVLGVSVGVVALVLLPRRRDAHPKSVKMADDSGPLPPSIRAHVDELLVLRQFYFMAAATNRAAGTIVEQIDLLVENVVGLFQRLHAKADKSERRRALAEYDENLGKFVAALGRDYGLDIIDNPRLWDAPDQRIANVQEALQAVDAQLVENIKQVNARQRLVFDARVDRLMDPRALGG